MDGQQVVNPGQQPEIDPIPNHPRYETVRVCVKTNKAFFGSFVGKPLSSLY